MECHGERPCGLGKGRSHLTALLISALTGPSPPDRSQT